MVRRTTEQGSDEAVDKILIHVKIKKSTHKDLKLLCISLDRTFSEVLDMLMEEFNGKP